MTLKSNFRVLLSKIFNFLVVGQRWLKETILILPVIIMKAAV